MTVDEYLAIPPSDQRTMLLYGTVQTLPSLGARQSVALHCLGLMLDRWIRGHGHGELHFGINMVLDCRKGLVHAPDLMFVSPRNKCRLRAGRVNGPASLCVDVARGTNPDFVACRRFADYQRYGVAWHWSVRPDRDQVLLEECQLVRGRYECRSEIARDQWFEPGVFPGLVFRLPPLLKGDLKAAVRGKAKKLM